MTARPLIRPTHRLELDPEFPRVDTHDLVSISVVGVMTVLLQGMWLRLRNGMPDRDSGLFLYMGQQILAGRVPYRDVWDHKPPLVYYIDAIGLLVGRGSLAGVWCLETLLLLVAGFCSLRILQRLVDWKLALLGTLTWLISLPTVVAGGNRTEEYILVTQFGVLYLFLRWDGESGLRWRGALVGGLIAVSIGFKQTAVGLPVALLVSIIVAAHGSGAVRHALRNIAWLVFGAGVVYSGPRNLALRHIGCSK